MRGYWEEIGSLEQRMDDLLHTVFGKRARLAYPALPLFVERRSCRRLTSWLARATSW